MSRSRDSIKQNAETLAAPDSEVTVGETKYSVYKNPGTPYVMAYICFCGLTALAAGEKMHGRFTGTCPQGHDSTVVTR